MIYPHELAMRMVPGKPWRPANGTEGELFVNAQCASCIHDMTVCDLIMRSFVHDIHAPEYPEEWVISDRGQPICTKFALVEPPEPRCEHTLDMFEEGGA